MHVRSWAGSKSVILPTPDRPARNASLKSETLQPTGAEITLVDYVPCWRTPAGTGEGMGLMYWNAAD